MATKHKAATAVTIASTQHETPLHDFVRRYWKSGLLIFAACAAAILLFQFRSGSAREDVNESWDRLGAVANFETMAPPESAQALGDLAVELQGDSAAPWAKAMQVGALVGEDDYEGARAALDELEAGWPDHELVRFGWPDGAGGEAPIPQQLRNRIQALEAWKTAHSSLTSNPPLPENAPRVRLKTSAGEILLGLYQDQAPRHVENFLERCRSGYYSGTSFHRIVAGFMIQGGDPNSRNLEDRASWGQGGPPETIPAEPSALKHFPYVLAAAKKGQDPDSSGSQFYITVGTSKAHHLDGMHTVFGAVLEGQAVVDAIASGEVTGEQPNEPVVVESAEVL
jgi:cyclophilin family peptidyl-prolyl cis-trans isomerase